MDVNELKLNDDELIEYEAKISKRALIMIWAVIPALFLFIFLTAYLPVIITYSVDTALRNALLEELGLESLNFGAIRNEIYQTVFSFAPKGVISFVKGFVVFLIILLAACWFGWACVYTFINSRYSLIITNRRVFAKAKDKVFQTEFPKILNVSVAKSVWGRLFKYGEILIQSEKDAITVANISNAENVKNILLAKSEEYKI